VNLHSGVARAPVALPLALALVLGVGLVAGCTGASSGRPPGAPDDLPPSGVLPPSPGQSVPVVTTALPAAPSTHADPELEAALPDSVRDVALTRSSVAAADLAGTSAEPALAELAQRIGQPLEALTLASAVDPRGQLLGGINAMRVRGGSSDALLQAILEIEQRTVESDVADVVVGGRSVTRLTQRDEGTTVTRYLYGAGDTVFVVLAPDEPTAAAFLEAIP